MRWIVALVTACCLLAAGGARPDVRGGRDAQLARATSGAVVVAPRRDGGHRDLRIGAYVVPVGEAGGVPPRVSPVASERVIGSVWGRPAPVPVSRGPPRG